jgi:hypothetical protein
MANTIIEYRTDNEVQADKVVELSAIPTKNCEPTE